MKIDGCDMILILYGIITILYSISLYVKRNKPKNNIRFFVKSMQDKKCQLYIKDKNDNFVFISTCANFDSFGLDIKDFADMKEGQLREVYLNLKG